jgi:hypothetical protein
LERNRRQDVLLQGFFVRSNKVKWHQLVGSLAAVQQLWKTIFNNRQSATYSRSKCLFCHRFDLFSFTVEVTVNKLVAVGYKP